MVSLQACPGKALRGDGVTAKGMSQNVRSPNDPRFIGGLLHHPLQLSTGFYRATLSLVWLQTSEKIIGNFNQFAAMIFALAGWEIDEFAVKLYLAPIQPFNLASAKTGESGDCKEWNGFRMNEGKKSG